MLLGNYSVFNKSPGRFLAASSQCDRSNWNTSGSSRNFYYTDSGDFNTASNVLLNSHTLFYYGTPLGGSPPYSWLIPQTSGGMVMRCVGSSSVTQNLIPQYPMGIAITGSGSLAATILGIGNILCGLTGSSSFSANITASGNIAVSLSGSSTVVFSITGNGNIILPLTGSGTLNAAASLFLNMIAAMTGSGALSGNASLLVGMLCSMTGSSTMTLNITGQQSMVASMTGTSTLSGNMAAFAEMVANLLGSGTLNAGFGAIANMSIDMVVTGAGLTVGNVGKAVWDSLAASFNAAGTMGNKMNSAASAGDPWGAILPGTYVDGEAGAILAQIKLLVDELHKVGGLDPANPSTTTQTAIDAGTIHIDLSGDGVNSTTLTRT